jgi:acyl transferase domain-containing protein
VLAEATARLWTSGVELDWRALHPAPRRRVPLPTYPFQRTRFRLDAPPEVRPAVPDEQPVEPERARTRTEKVLAAAFADALGMPDVGLHDNFFELGGYSLVALRVIAAVRPELGDTLTARSFLAAPTVAELAALVEGEETDR